MTKVQIYTSKGAKSGELEFPKELIAQENAGLMTQAFHVFEDRSHKGTNKVKTRAEVSLSTRKIYRQKGTGGARHGDKKAPIFVGGGVAHGPKGIKRELGLPKRLNRLALKMFLTQKVSTKSICIASGLGSITKTKEAANLLSKLSKDMDKASNPNILVVLADDKKDVVKYFRNIKEVKKIFFWKDLNLKDVYLSNLVVIDKDAVENKTKKLKNKKTEKQKIKKQK